MKKSKNLSRRTFLKTGSAAAGYILHSASGVKALTKESADANVYSTKDEKLITGTAVNYQEVRSAVDCIVKRMFGEATVDLAWQSIFPGITTSKKIAIKINCLNTDISPRFEAVKALIESIKSMFNNTYPAGNISLFDNNLWKTGKVDAAYGANNLDALGIWHGEDSYGPKTASIVGNTGYVSKKIDESDYGISLAALKPHQYYAGYLSGTIKNMMGAISKTASTYEAIKGGSGTGQFHDKNNHAGFKDLFKNYFANKINLYFVDMLFGTKHENFNSWTTVVKRITMGTDPCAVDSYIVDVIKDPLLTPTLKNYDTTNAVPKALEDAGLGTTNYTLVNVPLSTDPAPKTLKEIQSMIKNHGEGSKNTEKVQETINSYLKQ